MKPPENVLFVCKLNPVTEVSSQKNLCRLYWPVYCPHVLIGLVSRITVTNLLYVVGMSTGRWSWAYLWAIWQSQVVSLLYLDFLSFFSFYLKKIIWIFVQGFVGQYECDFSLCGSCGLRWCFAVTIRRADIIRDFKTGDSLCYAFIGRSCCSSFPWQLSPILYGSSWISDELWELRVLTLMYHFMVSFMVSEFETEEACEAAYFKVSYWRIFMFMDELCSSFLCIISLFFI